MSSFDHGFTGFADLCNTLLATPVARVCMHRKALGAAMHAARGTGDVEKLYVWLCCRSAAWSAGHTVSH